MKYPTFTEEKKLWKKGHNMVVGLDESGRGPLAGPVVAAAVIVRKFSIFPPDFACDLPASARRWQAGRTRWRAGNFQFSKIKDSKKLSPKKREDLYRFITKNSAIEWGIGIVSEKVIDRINILKATKLAMKKAISKIFNFSAYHQLRLRQMAGKQFSRASLGGLPVGLFFNSDIFLILDGNFKIDLSVPQKSIIKADEKVFSCALASVVAKVTRDRIMKKYHQKYPQYGFDKHKGYPTKFHRRVLKKYGPCKIHRMSFKPVLKCKM